jgi:hypothetical protein
MFFSAREALPSVVDASGPGPTQAGPAPPSSRASIRTPPPRLLPCLLLNSNP